ncbi:tetratricopeptide repeat protein [Bacteroides ovatus]|uniref:Tetratricopeptide repeat protein n=2 Tax=Bacteroides ovatus TaxID=28116 RepID=A0A6A1CBC7_BACOV|nr:tetratricopeptide repeat protein [Bacteroides ovatus]
MEKLSIEEISIKSAKAMYALLLTEALDKNFKSHRNDSLILIAVDYYKDNSNNKLKTKAYYYLGRVYQDNKEYIKATEAYLTALKTASPNQAPILQIYNNLALCYESQEFYLPAIKTYKESYATAEKMQDKYGILHATRGLGNVYAIQDEEEKALSYYQKALSIAQSIKDSLWENAIFCDIAKVYDDQGLYIEAKKQIDLALRYAPSNINLSPTYFWKGSILYNLEETDSAIHYLSRASTKANIYTKASIYQTLYEINKENKNYEQAILYNDTALTCYDSIQKIIHHTEINNLIKKHSIDIYKEQIKKQSQQTKVIFIIGGLVTMFLFIYTVMYISNRNKKTHIHWQQLLMKNQTEKATLKEEIRALSHANEINEHRYADILNQRIKLWHQSLQICVRLFKTTTSYKKIQSIETSKNKKEKEITQEELSLIYQEINEAFIEAMQELLEQYPSLTQDDLYYCILNYLQLSNNTIKVCMKAGSQSALTQRKYRIKKQLSDLSFSIIFDAKGEGK